MAKDACPAAPAVLQNLIAAGLVSHEMIGDPEHLGSESAALRVLCGLVSGPIYRIEPYHYAFLAQKGDVAGALGSRAPGDWAGVIEAGLQAALGTDAVWVHSTDILESDEATLPEQPILFLKAFGDAAVQALATAETQAVINAHFASETARLTAERAAAIAAEVAAETVAREGSAEAGLAARLWSIESEMGRIAERLAARSDPQAALAPLAERIAGLAARIDAEAARTTAFEEKIGLVLAEFLARIEMQSRPRAGGDGSESIRAFAPHLG